MNKAVKLSAAGEELDVLLARSCTQRFGAAVASLLHMFGNVGNGCVSVHRDSGARVFIAVCATTCGVS